MTVLTADHQLKPMEGPGRQARRVFPRETGIAHIGGTAQRSLLHRRFFSGAGDETDEWAAAWRVRVLAGQEEISAWGRLEGDGIGGVIARPRRSGEKH